MTIFKRRFEKPRSLTPLFLAAVLTSLAFLLSIGLLGMRYYSNDDSMLAAIAAGAFGDSIRLIHCNIFFGLLLRPFYWIAFANWYVLVQLIACAVALCSVFALLIKKLPIISGILWSFVFLFCYGYLIYYYFQYTVSAFVIISCGLILVAESFDRFSATTVVGIALTLFGSWVRFECFFAAGALSAILLLLRFFDLEKSQRKMAVFVMSVLFLLVFGSEIIDRFVYAQDPDWAAYVEYNNARTVFSDCATYSLENAQSLSSFGISDVDFIMLEEWNFYDPARFTPDLLNQMSQSLLKQSESNTITVFSSLFSFLKENPLQAFLLLSILILCLISIKFNLRAFTPIGTILVFVALLFLIQAKYNGRLTQWLAIGLLFALCINLVYLLVHLKSNAAGFWPVPLLLLCLGVVLGWQMYLDFYRYTDDYLAVRAENHAYIERLSEEPENIYFLSTVSSSFSLSEDMWTPSAEGSFDNVVLLGGWMCYHPNRTAVLEKYGITRPIVDSVDNPNAYFDHHDIEDVVAYASQELGCEVVAVATGQNAYCPYQLVRVSNN